MSTEGIELAFLYLSYSFTTKHCTVFVMPRMEANLLKIRQNVTYLSSSVILGFKKVSFHFQDL